MLTNSRGYQIGSCDKVDLSDQVSYNIKACYIIREGDINCGKIEDR